MANRLFKGSQPTRGANHQSSATGAFRSRFYHRVTRWLLARLRSVAASPSAGCTVLIDVRGLGRSARLPSSNCCTCASLAYEARLSRRAQRQRRPAGLFCDALGDEGAAVGVHARRHLHRVVGVEDGLRSRLARRCRGMAWQCMGEPWELAGESAVAAHGEVAKVEHELGKGPGTSHKLRASSIRGLQANCCRCLWPHQTWRHRQSQLRLQPLPEPAAMPSPCRCMPLRTLTCRSQ